MVEAVRLGRLVFVLNFYKILPSFIVLEQPSLLELKVIFQDLYSYC